LIKFKLLSPKTSDILIINFKAVSGMGMRPGRTTCVNVTSVSHYVGAAVLSSGARQVFTLSPIGSREGGVGGLRQPAPGEGGRDVADSTLT
jgi:hypothetical protein